MGKLEQTPVLSPEEGVACAVVNPAGSSPVLLVCEHASNVIPASLQALGLDDDARQSHVAWDPGALAVAQELSRILDATLVHARFSRLVYDCNRPPEAESAMPPRSEVFDIPGNTGLTPAEREARTKALYVPFTETLSGEISRRTQQGRPPVLVTIHSFTPVYYGKQREVELGILHDADTALADAMLDAQDETTLLTRRNEPYGPDDGVTHTLQLHGLGNGLPNVMIEVRNDMLESPVQQKKVAQDLAAMLERALKSITLPETEVPDV